MPRRKTEDTPRDRSARGRSKASETAADLARGANGLTDYFEAQEAAVQGMMKAHVEAMNTVMTASMAATTTSLRAMASFWTVGLGATTRADTTKDKDESAG